MHHKLIYIKRTNVMQLGSKFICNCNIAIFQLQINILPSCITLVLFIYNSHDVSLCGGRICNLYVDVTVAILNYDVQDLEAT